MRGRSIRVDMKEEGFMNSKVVYYERGSLNLF